MKLVIIIGSGAVGKMTVGQELMKITDLRLFHNHMMIEPVIEIFDSFDGKVIQRLREVIFEEFLRSDQEGMIFTFMWAFDMPSDREYIMNVAKKFDEVYCVELVADQSVRLERNRTENRLKNKASKRDLSISDQRLIREDTNHRLVSLEGEIPFENYIRIDNTNLAPDAVAKIIKEQFSL
jgi:tRNA uridine 5-carbamoylmethylation protein Kti12